MISGHLLRHLGLRPMSITFRSKPSFCFDAVKLVFFPGVSLVVFYFAFLSLMSDVVNLRTFWFGFYRMSHFGRT